MSSAYSSLANYNEVFARKRIVLQEGFQEKYPCELIDCALEGYFFDPPVDTTLSAILVITVLSKGLMYYCRLRSPPKTISRLFFQYNKDKEVDLPISTTDIVSKGFLRYNTQNFPISRIDFQHLVRHSQFHAILCTPENPDGELAGTCQVVM